MDIGSGKVGLGAAGGFRSAVHMVAIVAGYRKAFIGPGPAISLHLCTNGLRKYPSYLIRVSFLALGIFQ